MISIYTHINTLCRLWKWKNNISQQEEKNFLVDHLSLKIMRRKENVFLENSYILMRISEN